MRAGLSHRLRTRSMVEDRTVEPYRVAITRGHAEPQAAVAGAGPDRRPVAGAEAEAEGQAAGRMPRQAPLGSQVLPDFGVASVYISTKLQAAIGIREGGLVHHKYRHGLW